MHTPKRIYFFFLKDPATPEIYPLSLHDALPIWLVLQAIQFSGRWLGFGEVARQEPDARAGDRQCAAGLDAPEQARRVCLRELRLGQTGRTPSQIGRAHV